MEKPTMSAPNAKKNMNNSPNNGSTAKVTTNENHRWKLHTNTQKLGTTQTRIRTQKNHTTQRENMHHLRTIIPEDIDELQIEETKPPTDQQIRDHLHDCMITGDIPDSSIMINLNRSLYKTHLLNL